MSVFFRLHQDQSVGTKRSGKWYARMVPTSVINTRQLAEIMQRNCTVKKAEHQGHAHRVHPRALYRRCRQPREAVPAGSEVRGAA